MVPPRCLAHDGLEGEPRLASATSSCQRHHAVGSDGTLRVRYLRFAANKAGDLLRKVQPSTVETVKLAKDRLAEARERARNAHLSSVKVHELAAQAHDDAAEHNIGDVEMHVKAAAVHRAARDRAYRAAEQERVID